MKWIKKGIIYCPDATSWWAQHSALQPTPLLRSDGTIRVFVGFRDALGVGRVGYIDVSAENPKIVNHVSQEPALDIGLPGAFDDNGVVPCAVVVRDSKLYLYYAGYQIATKVRFLVFSGLAISENGGESFLRIKNVPIMERTHEEFLFRVVHTALADNGIWKIWYGGGSHFVEVGGKTVPVYNIRYTESTDGLSFPAQGKICVDLKSGEYRVGRPYVLKCENKYRMFFAASSHQTPFRLAYAESTDGVVWHRNDEKVDMGYSIGDFDEHMSSYPSLVQYKNKTYLFYNGNDYGRYGVAYAELKEGTLDD